MSGASNTLAREFLTDVHQLCSAVAQRAEARDEDEEESHMVALGEYLVRGRGFLLLSTLDSIIDQVWVPVLMMMMMRMMHVKTINTKWLRFFHICPYHVSDVTCLLVKQLFKHSWCFDIPFIHSPHCYHRHTCLSPVVDAQEEMRSAGHVCCLIFFTLLHSASAINTVLYFHVISSELWILKCDLST